jgi:hypothetical protein
MHSLLEGDTTTLNLSFVKPGEFGDKILNNRSAPQVPLKVPSTLGVMLTNKTK